MTIYEALLRKLRRARLRHRMKRDPRRRMSEKDRQSGITSLTLIARKPGSDPSKGDD